MFNFIASDRFLVIALLVLLVVYVLKKYAYSKHARAQDRTTSLLSEVLGFGPEVPSNWAVLGNAMYVSQWALIVVSILSTLLHIVAFAK